MDFKIIDTTGSFKSYIRTLFRTKVAKYMHQRKEIIYLPKDLNEVVREELLDLAIARKEVETLKMKLAKSGAYCFEIRYKEIKPKGK